jgi:hypothetical protein
MTAVCVIIASHISYNSQLDLLKNCIHSLKKQTMNADIYVCISFENDKYKQTFYEQIFEQEPDVNFIISSIQQYQMQHIYHVRGYINHYDLVMFCDDDDTYECNRVEIIYKSYQYCLSQKTDGKLLGGFIEIIDVERHDAPEFWCYALVPSLIHDFYERMKEDIDLLAYDYGDMYFRNYLRLVHTGITFASCKFIKPLYNHTKNPFSVCSRKGNDAVKYIRNVIILLTICMYDVDFITNKLQISEKDLYTFVPELDRVRKIKDKLYDNIARSYT